MSTLEWLMILVFVFWVGFVIGVLLYRRRANYMWRNIPPYILEQVAEYRRRRWEQEKKEDTIDSLCGL